MTAKPAVGFIFNGWSGTVSSSSTKLTFTMQSNLVLQATFVPIRSFPSKETMRDCSRIQRHSTGQRRLF